MIKELFATCLLSASVGTSGLNMQTRENQSTYRIEFPEIEDWLYNGISYTNGESTIYSKFRASGGNDQLQYEMTVCTEMPMYSENRNYYRCNSDNAYEIYMYKLHVGNMTIYNTEMDLTLEYNYAPIGGWGNNYLESWMGANKEINAYLTTNQQIVEEIQTWKQSDNNSLHDMVEGLSWGQYGYNNMQLINWYDYENNGNTDYDNPSTNIPLNNGYQYLIITTKLSFADEPEPYLQTNFSNTQSMTSNQHLTRILATISGTYGPAIINEGVVDIPGLMFTVLTMPFTFISQAFNLTLFPGTPYQVNISMLFLAIIATLIFVWIITTILKHK